MKIAKIVLLAMVIALASTSLGMAAGAVQTLQSVYVSADVKNTADYDLQAAVKVTGYDNVGNAVGHVCREVTLPANDTITVTYRWRAPAYKTGLYWSSKVDIDGSCINHDGDDTDSDSDSDGDSDDSDD